MDKIGVGSNDKETITNERWYRKCMGKQCEDLTGKTFYYLTAISLIRMEKRKSDPLRSNAVWLFECQCGNKIQLQARYVKRGFRKSCGCHVNRGWKVVAQHVYKNIYADGDITLNQFIDLSQQPCHYCGDSLSNDRTINNNNWKYNGLDRINNEPIHNYHDVVPCCWPCNEKKSDMGYGDFLNWINKIYNRRMK